MPSIMNHLIDPRRLVAASLFIFLLSACAPAAVPETTPPPSLETPAADTATRTPALVSFPTSAPDTPAPAATATLTAVHLAASIPVVQLVSPISNTQVSISQTVYVSVFAADDNGIARIELYDDATLVKT
ncbi:MAG: hypothetical protein KGJ80_01020, partial [Chloroflexota bacterium]|nr:hypothetical protein [Chloroflexota bacterium]